MCKSVRIIFVFATFLAVVCGCEKSGGKGDSRVAANAGERILSVDGEVLTRGQIDDHVRLMYSLARGANPGMKAQQAETLRRQFVTTYPDLFIQGVLIRNYAQREKLTVPPEKLRHFQELSLRKARYLKVKSYDALMKKLGKRATVFDGLVRDEALADVVREHVIAVNPTNLPPDFAEKKLAEIKAFNKRMDATNAVIHARAEEAWRKLKAGESFEKVVDAYTEIEEERADKGEWGLLDSKMLDGFPELQRAVSKLKVGEFSKPVEGDNGLLIVRLDSRDEAKDEFTLSRIYFQLPMFIAELKPEKLIALAKKEHAERVWRDSLASWRQKAKIEYFKANDEKKKGVSK